MVMSGLRLEVQNFRALRQLDWRPEGICVLTGPNGSGKSTALSALRFLRALLTVGTEAAFTAVDGAYMLSLGAAPGTDVVFRLHVADIVWTIRLPVSVHGLAGTFGETLSRGGSTLIEAASDDDHWHHEGKQFVRDTRRCVARTLYDRGDAPWMKPFIDTVTALRVYGPYALPGVMEWRSAAAVDKELHGTGKNVWGVLQTWQSSPRIYEGRFEWVMANARKAFPDTFDTVEFDRGLPHIFAPGATDASDGLPPFVLSSGLLTGLLHLTAIAGAAPGSLVAFDAFEGQLEPVALLLILASVRERAAAHDLTVVLVTHSQAVLDQFHGEPGRLKELGGQTIKTPQPVRLAESTSRSKPVDTELVLRAVNVPERHKWEA
jgi:hypothetical protein